MTTQRPYERTHPWLTFNLDLRRLKPADWLALGEAAAKCGQIANAPLTPQVSDDIHQRYLAKGALATTAIEGNTLSEDEALAALAGSLKLPPSREYLKRELDQTLRHVPLGDSLVAINTVRPCCMCLHLLHLLHLECT